MNMRILSPVIFVLVASVFAEPPSGPRAALLIGNAKYDGFPLNGVGKSLDLVEKTLRDQGYRVTRHENLKEKELGFIYWCWNPNGGDTGGLVKDDWKTEEAHKVRLLQSLLGK